MNIQIRAIPRKIVDLILSIIFFLSALILVGYTLLIFERGGFIVRLSAIVILLSAIILFNFISKKYFGVKPAE
ncbi:MAG: hypothetical protein U9O55_01290 [Patescibacteria group bacterium]|nr:hypothetical protein [Patescibacteria group bacterium]